MAKTTLRDLYIEQVQDMHSACIQSQGMTRRLADAATAQDLTAALIDGVKGIERGRDTMDQMARAQGAEATGKHSKGMEGLVAEAQSHVFDTDFDDDDVRDAAIIAEYQRMAHYAISGYGTIRAFAERLGLKAERDASQDCLDKSYDGDKRFTEIAESHVNRDAA